MNGTASDSDALPDYEVVKYRMAGIFLTSANDDESAKPLVRSRWGFEDGCEAKIIVRRIHIFSAVDLPLNFGRRCMGEASVDNVDQSAVTRPEQVARIEDNHAVGPEQGPVPAATCHNLPFQPGSCDFAPEERHEASRPSRLQRKAQTRPRRKFQSDAECKFESWHNHQQSSPAAAAIRQVYYTGNRRDAPDAEWSGSPFILLYKLNSTKWQLRRPEPRWRVQGGTKSFPTCSPQYLLPTLKWLYKVITHGGESTHWMELQASGNGW